MRALLSLIFLVAVLCAPRATVAAIPPTINYQGYLTNSSGSPVNGSVNMTFRIYTAASGGSAIWSETQTAVMISNGNFSLMLGSASPLTPLDFDVPYWLTLAVNADPEMLPRQAFGSVPYAVTASALLDDTTIQGSQITGTITNATIAGSNVTGAITTATIGGAQITGDITVLGNVLKGGNVFLSNPGSQNTFLGQSAGNLTLSGSENTGVGAYALQGVGGGFNNTATGFRAGNAMFGGYQNSAFGAFALRMNTEGYNNSAFGNGALENLTIGFNNTAFGRGTLAANNSGLKNVALGFLALSQATGNRNTAVGADAGSVITNGSDNIHIGHVGTSADNNLIRIGLGQTATYIAGIRGVTPGADPLPVLIDNTGQLAVGTSTRTVKEAIADMGRASDILMQLRPVTFHYSHRLAAGDRKLQFGLIAEEVATAAPDLVARATDGRIESVLYQHLPPMLLNEVQKQQRTIRAQAGELESQRERLATLEQELAALKAAIGLRSNLKRAP